MEEETNSFKRLLEEDESHYLEHHHEEVANRLYSSVQIFRLVGDLFHLFVPRFADSVTMSMDTEDHLSNLHEPKPKGESAPPSQARDDDRGPAGPLPANEPPAR